MQTILIFLLLKKCRSSWSFFNFWNVAFYATANAASIISNNRINGILKG